jgi:ABC-2 type transport system ATP-binding protein
LEGKVKDIKTQYKTNAYAIDFDGFEGTAQSILPAGYSLLNEVLDDEMRKITVQLPGQATQNELLQAIMPHVNIHTFKEIIPTMNEIFIKTVNESGNFVETR